MVLPTFGEAFPAIMAVVVSAAAWFGTRYMVRHKHDGSKARARRP